MSKLETISNFFYVDGVGPYLGRVMASENEIYLAAGMAPLNAKSLFSGTFGKPGSIGQDSLPLRLSELPVSITADPAWPIKSNDGRVCVFNKDSVVNMWCSLLGNLKLSDAEHTAIIRSGMIKRFAMLRILRRFGWPV